MALLEAKGDYEEDADDDETIQRKVVEAPKVFGDVQAEWVNELLQYPIPDKISSGAPFLRVLPPSVLYGLIVMLQRWNLPTTSRVSILGT